MIQLTSFQSFQLCAKNRSKSFHLLQIFDRLKELNSAKGDFSDI